ncbi:hypothetical protein [Kribbella swartbergensis]
MVPVDAAVVHADRPDAALVSVRVAQADLDAVVALLTAVADPGGDRHNAAAEHDARRTEHHPSGANHPSRTEHHPD